MSAALTLAEPPGGQTLVEGDYPLTGADFRAIAAMVRDDAGIALPQGKAAMVYSRLARRLRELGLRSFHDYCTLVGSEAGGAERQRMLAALTTNVTRFFREPHHFDHLRRTVLPPLIELARSGGAIRLWSAACSSGMEPYSMAMTLLSVMPDAARRDVRILATDINLDMITAGRRGVYPQEAGAQIPAELRRRYVIPAGDEPGMIQMNEEVRALVHFRRLNLVGQWPLRRGFQAIFCRNVMIYFDAETQAGVWARMLPLLSDGGILYIGHSERVAGPAAGALRTEGVTTYRRVRDRRA